jgi:nucleoside-diphosphate-sugar epimerase
MRVFVTGATGFIGFAIVKELTAAGHQVIGLARSAESGKKLTAAGARVLLGSVADIDVLRRAAATVDGAVHAAYYHKISHIPFGKRMGVFLGGAPGGIVQRFMQAGVEADRLALKTIGEAFAGTDRPLVAPFATMGLRPGQLATEDQSYDPTFFAAPRAETETLLQELASKGVRTSAIRLPPIVHGAGDQGFAPMLITTARKKKESGYAGDGLNRWPSVHRFDAARLFRLALENGPKGGTYHGVAEEGIPFRQIAELIGKRLEVPAVSKSPAEAKKQFTFLADFVMKDNPTSSKRTQELLGWRPTESGLLDDMDQADYFKD